jgi:hypothetical protein
MREVRSVAWWMDGWMGGWVDSRASLFLQRTRRVSVGGGEREGSWGWVLSWLPWPLLLTVAWLFPQGLGGGDTKSQSSFCSPVTSWSSPHSHSTGGWAWPCTAHFGCHGASTVWQPVLFLKQPLVSDRRYGACTWCPHLARKVLQVCWERALAPSAPTLPPASTCRPR